MKAEIRKFAKYYQWFFYYNNGDLACQSSFYTRKSGAKRGLHRFLENFSSSALLELDKNSEKGLILL